MKTVNKNPKVSIIIVNYNNAKFLSKCINSVLNQSYKCKEIIVLDDNSQDNTIEVLKKFKKKIKIIKNKKKTLEGSFNQINCYHRGFLKSKTDYLFFLDSDDYFKKNKIKVIMNEFKKKKDLEIIFDLPIWKFQERSIKKKFKQKFFSYNWPRFSPQSCIIVKKKFAKEFFNYIRIKKFETLWLDFRIASYSFIKNQKIFIIKEYLTYYRQLDNSASKKFKFLSKNWWQRRAQAHNFIIYLEKKFKLNSKITIDKILTRFVNLFLYD